jgi:tetratricopeptide (TPR) repeat protein
VLATLYDEQRRFRESAAMLGLIAGSSRRLYGDDNPAVVINYYNWGAKLQDMGDNGAAEPAFRLALELHEHAQGGDQPYIAATMNALGKAVGARGDRAGCDSLQSAGLAMRRRLFGNLHAEVAWSLHAMGDARHERGDHADALPLLRECVAIRDSVLSADDWPRWGARSDLGRCLVDLGRFAEAVPILESAVKGLGANAYTGDLADAARKLLVTARRPATGQSRPR